MANKELFDEWRIAQLAEYNKGKEAPVGKYDSNFSVYLMGYLSVLVTDEALERTLP
jgi:deoxyribodipyrimidine photolyase